MDTEDKALKFMVEHVERKIERKRVSMEDDLGRAADKLRRILADRDLGRQVGSREIQNVINTLMRAEAACCAAAAAAETLRDLTIVRRAAQDARPA